MKNTKNSRIIKKANGIVEGNLIIFTLPLFKLLM